MSSAKGETEEGERSATPIPISAPGHSLQAAVKTSRFPIGQLVVANYGSGAYLADTIVGRVRYVGPMSSFITPECPTNGEELRYTGPLPATKLFSDATSTCLAFAPNAVLPVKLGTLRVLPTEVLELVALCCGYSPKRGSSHVQHYLGSFLKISGFFIPPCSKAQTANSSRSQSPERPKSARRLVAALQQAEGTPGGEQRFGKVATPNDGIHWHRAFASHSNSLPSPPHGVIYLIEPSSDDGDRAGQKQVYSVPANLLYGFLCVDNEKKSNRFRGDRFLTERQSGPCICCRCPRTSEIVLDEVRSCWAEIPCGNSLQRCKKGIVLDGSGADTVFRRNSVTDVDEAGLVAIGRAAGLVRGNQFVRAGSLYTIVRYVAYVNDHRAYSLSVQFLVDFVPPVDCRRNQPQAADTSTSTPTNTRWQQRQQWIQAELSRGDASAVPELPNDFLLRPHIQSTQQSQIAVHFYDLPPSPFWCSFMQATVDGTSAEPVADTQLLQWLRGFNAADVFYRDSVTGYTPLAAAVAFGASGDVLRYLTVNLTSFIFHPMAYHRSPVHMACRQAPSETILVLLDALTSSKAKLELLLHRGHCKMPCGFDLIASRRHDGPAILQEVVTGLLHSDSEFVSSSPQPPQAKPTDVLPVPLALSDVTCVLTLFTEYQIEPPVELLQRVLDQPTHVFANTFQLLALKPPANSFDQEGSAEELGSAGEEEELDPLIKRLLALDSSTPTVHHNGEGDERFLVSPKILTAKNWQGGNVLHMAVASKNETMVGLLLKKGPRPLVSAADGKGNIPLTVALSQVQNRKGIAIAEQLLQTMSESFDRAFLRCSVESLQALLRTALEARYLFLKGGAPSRMSCSAQGAKLVDVVVAKVLAVVKQQQTTSLDSSLGATGNGGTTTMELGPEDFFDYQTLAAITRWAPKHLVDSIVFPSASSNRREAIGGDRSSIIGSVPTVPEGRLLEIEVEQVTEERHDGTGGLLWAAVSAQRWEVAQQLIAQYQEHLTTIHKGDTSLTVFASPVGKSRPPRLWPLSAALRHSPAACEEEEGEANDARDEVIKKIAESTLAEIAATAAAEGYEDTRWEVFFSVPGHAIAFQYISADSIARLGDGGRVSSAGFLRLWYDSFQYYIKSNNTTKEQLQRLAQEDGEILSALRWMFSCTEEKSLMTRVLVTLGTGTPDFGGFPVYGQLFLSAALQVFEENAGNLSEEDIQVFTELAAHTVASKFLAAPSILFEYLRPKLATLWDRIAELPTSADDANVPGDEDDEIYVVGAMYCVATTSSLSVALKLWKYFRRAKQKHSTGSVAASKTSSFLAGESGNDREQILRSFPIALLPSDEAVLSVLSRGNTAEDDGGGDDDEGNMALLDQFLDEILLLVSTKSTLLFLGRTLSAGRTACALLLLAKLVRKGVGPNLPVSCCGNVFLRGNNPAATILRDSLSSGSCLSVNCASSARSTAQLCAFLASLIERGLPSSLLVLFLARLEVQYTQFALAYVTLSLAILSGDDDNDDDNGTSLSPVISREQMCDYFAAIIQLISQQHTTKTFFLLPIVNEVADLLPNGKEGTSSQCQWRLFDECDSDDHSIVKAACRQYAFEKGTDPRHPSSLLLCLLSPALSAEKRCVLFSQCLTLLYSTGKTFEEPRDDWEPFFTASPPRVYHSSLLQLLHQPMKRPVSSRRPMLRLLCDRLREVLGDAEISGNFKKKDPHLLSTLLYPAIRCRDWGLVEMLAKTVEEKQRIESFPRFPANSTGKSVVLSCAPFSLLLLLVDEAELTAQEIVALLRRGMGTSVAGKTALAAILTAKERDSSATADEVLKLLCRHGTAEEVAAWVEQASSILSTSVSVETLLANGDKETKLSLCTAFCASRKESFLRQHFQKNVLNSLFEGDPMQAHVHVAPRSPWWKVLTALLDRKDPSPSKECSLTLSTFIELVGEAQFATLLLSKPTNANLSTEEEEGNPRRFKIEAEFPLLFGVLCKCVAHHCPTGCCLEVLMNLPFPADTMDPTKLCTIAVAAVQRNGARPQHEGVVDVIGRKLSADGKALSDDDFALQVKVLTLPLFGARTELGRIRPQKLVDIAVQNIELHVGDSTTESDDPRQQMVVNAVNMKCLSEIPFLKRLLRSSRYHPSLCDYFADHFFPFCRKLAADGGGSADGVSRRKPLAVFEAVVEIAAAARLPSDYTLLLEEAAQGMEPAEGEKENDDIEQEDEEQEDEDDDEARSTRVHRKSVFKELTKRAVAMRDHEYLAWAKCQPEKSPLHISDDDIQIHSAGFLEHAGLFERTGRTSLALARVFSCNDKRKRLPITEPVERVAVSSRVSTANRRRSSSFGIAVSSSMGCDDTQGFWVDHNTMHEALNCTATADEIRDEVIGAYLECDRNHPVLNMLFDVVPVFTKGKLSLSSEEPISWRDLLGFSLPAVFRGHLLALCRRSSPEGPTKEASPSIVARPDCSKILQVKLQPSVGGEKKALQSPYLSAFYEAYCANVVRRVEVVPQAEYTVALNSDGTLTLAVRSTQATVEPNTLTLLSLLEDLLRNLQSIAENGKGTGLFLLEQLGHDVLPQCKFSSSTEGERQTDRSIDLSDIIRTEPILHTAMTSTGTLAGPIPFAIPPVLWKFAILVQNVVQREHGSTGTPLPAHMTTGTLLQEGERPFLPVGSELQSLQWLLVKELYYDTERPIYRPPFGVAGVLIGRVDAQRASAVDFTDEYLPPISLLLSDETLLSRGAQQEQLLHRFLTRCVGASTGLVPRCLKQYIDDVRDLTQLGKDLSWGASTLPDCDWLYDDDEEEEEEEGIDRDGIGKYDERQCKTKTKSDDVARAAGRTLCFAVETLKKELIQHITVEFKEASTPASPETPQHSTVDIDIGTATLKFTYLVPTECENASDSLGASPSSLVHCVATPRTQILLERLSRFLNLYLQCQFDKNLEFDSNWRQPKMSPSLKDTDVLPAQEMVKGLLSSLKRHHDTLSRGEASSSTAAEERDEEGGKQWMASSSLYKRVTSQELLVEALAHVYLDDPVTQRDFWDAVAATESLRECIYGHVKLRTVVGTQIQENTTGDLPEDSSSSVPVQELLPVKIGLGLDYQVRELVLKPKESKLASRKRAVKRKPAPKPRKINELHASLELQLAVTEPLAMKQPSSAIAAIEGTTMDVTEFMQRNIRYGTQVDMQCDRTALDGVQTKIIEAKKKANID